MLLRTRLLVIIGFILVVIGALVAFLVFRNRQPAAVTPAPGNSRDTLPPGTTVIDRSNFDSGLAASAPAAAEIPSGLAVKPLTSEEAVKKGVQQLAKIFIERYGSYSTDSNFQNVSEVQALVTPALWERIKPKTTPAATAAFVGVTTEVVTMDMNSFQADAKAEVVLTAIRAETKGGQETRTQGTATVTMVKVGTNWLVDSFVWSK